LPVALLLIIPRDAFFGFTMFQSRAMQRAMMIREEDGPNRSFTVTLLFLTGDISRNWK